MAAWEAWFLQGWSLGKIRPLRQQPVFRPGKLELPPLLLPGENVAVSAASTATARSTARASVGRTGAATAVLRASSTATARTSRAATGSRRVTAGVRPAPSRAARRGAAVSRSRTSSRAVGRAYEHDAQLRELLELEVVFGFPLGLLAR